jgi:hypothetical protein
MTGASWYVSWCQWFAVPYIDYDWRTQSQRQREKRYSRVLFTSFEFAIGVSVALHSNLFFKFICIQGRTFTLFWLEDLEMGNLNISVLCEDYVELVLQK